MLHESFFFLWLTCSMSALAALYMNYVVACMDLFFKQFEFMNYVQTH